MLSVDGRAALGRRSISGESKSSVGGDQDEDEDRVVYLEDDDGLQQQSAGDRLLIRGNSVYRSKPSESQQKPGAAPFHMPKLRPTLKQSASEQVYSDNVIFRTKISN
jgi:hypothetical protein